MKLTKVLQVEPENDWVGDKFSDDIARYVEHGYVEVAGTPDSVHPVRTIRFFILKKCKYGHVTQDRDQIADREYNKSAKKELFLMLEWLFDNLLAKNLFQEPVQDYIEDEQLDSKQTKHHNLCDCRPSIPWVYDQKSVEEYKNDPESQQRMKDIPLSH